MSVKKVLVTGASGFLGTHLTRALTKHGYTVFEVSSNDGDISDPATLSRFTSSSISHVFHCAAKTYVPDSWAYPNIFLKTNVLGTGNVLDFCRDNKCSITYVSAYIYGNPKVNPIKEDSGIYPNNPYAFSKKNAEDLCRFYNQHLGVNVNIVRPFNIYGPGQDPRFLIPYIISQAITGNHIIVKDLSPKRDYIFIDDVVECLIKTIDNKEFGIFNIGSGLSYSVEEIIKKIITLIQKEIKISSEQVERKNEIPDTIADISAAKEKLQWEPRVSINDGLRRTISEMLNQ